MLLATNMTVISTCHQPNVLLIELLFNELKYFIIFSGPTPRIPMQIVCCPHMFEQDHELET